MTDASLAMRGDPRRELATFLRARRTRLRPEDVGLEPGPRRRVAGLRREELALLAGVSANYYQRMEQGRDVRPSEQVLDALARALHFSAEESRHLHSLAAALDRLPPYPRTRTQQTAFLRDLADRLHLPRLAPTHQTCPERAATVAELIGMLRTQVAADPAHPRAVELVGELAVRSDKFTTLWARHDVEAPTRGRMRVDHPLVGELNPDWDAYPMPGSSGPMLIVCTTAEGSPDAERLQLLAGLLDAR
ncbi:helix-turn-helix transcriptional regulator [Streptomyces aurantiacus]|uniref:helix-turn-helix transcriptional regulator n=1 Tax=Streptomyces aurantiacus TaxID=47760 RepID=UPI003CCB898C